jgi:hypothetical protein
MEARQPYDLELRENHQEAPSKPQEPQLKQKEAQG